MAPLDQRQSLGMSVVIVLRLATARPTSSAACGRDGCSFAFVSSDLNVSCWPCVTGWRRSM